MKTMSEFIMEQEISDLTINDNAEIEVMEGFMKVQAVGAVAECYCEHAAIAEFANENGLNVFSESDESLGKKVWEGVKSFFSNIWEWIKAVVRAVVNIFTKSSIEPSFRTNWLALITSFIGSDAPLPPMNCCPKATAVLLFVGLMNKPFSVMSK